MISKRRFACLSVVVLTAFVFLVSGCNRAAVRVPGASLSFPETPTGFRTKATSYPYALVVSTPIDQRSQHYGERVAGTKWKGCSTDPFWATNASQIIEQRLVKELQVSGLFSTVTTTPMSPNDVMMRTEIHAFCSRVVGFLFARVAGIASLHVTLEQNGKVLVDHKFEKVVTDADKEYTGSQVGMIDRQ